LAANGIRDGVQEMEDASRDSEATPAGWRAWVTQVMSMGTLRLQLSGSRVQILYLAQQA
jgi:hypothetical protein